MNSMTVLEIVMFSLMAFLVILISGIFCHHDPKKILQIANDFSGVFSFLVIRILSDAFLHGVDLL